MRISAALSAVDGSTLTALFSVVALLFDRFRAKPTEAAVNIPLLYKELDIFSRLEHRADILRESAAIMLRHGQFMQVSLVEIDEAKHVRRVWQMNSPKSCIETDETLTSLPDLHAQVGIFAPVTVPERDGNSQYLLPVSLSLPRTAFLVMLLNNQPTVEQSLIALLIAEKVSNKLAPGFGGVPSRLAKVPPAGDPQPQKNPSRLLHLVRHRKSEDLVAGLVDFVQDDLKLRRVAYWYETGDSSRPIKVASGIDGLVVPDVETLIIASQLVEAKSISSVDDLKTQMAGVSHWPSTLQRSGFRHVAAFNLSDTKHGLLASDYSMPPQEISGKIQELQAAARELIANAESFEKVEQLSYTDPLTRLANNRYFTRRLAEELDRARRFNRQVALIIFDLDDLKLINDTHGHLAGDAVLRNMGDILRRSIRTIDIIARYGGDEFCVVMPDSDAKTCERFMRRLKLTIQSAPMLLDDKGKTLSCTISLGGALFPNHADTPERLLYTADMALLKAKEGGRNRYVLHEHSS